MGVIWLLLFAGSVTALLLMRSSAQMAETKKEAVLVRGRLALEGALDAIAAERLFGRADSPWMMAGSHTIDVEGVAVSGTVSAEDQRLDVSRAAAEAIDGELRAAGVSAATRIRTIGNISMALADGRIASLPALSALLADAQREAKSCLLERLTAFGGRTQPLGAQQEAAQLPPHALLRVTLKAPGGGAATAIMRSVPVGGTPLLILDWKAGAVCG